MITAIIVAAGQGLRMGGGLRKQYLPLCGKPILSHTLEAFDACPEVEHLIVVLPEEEIDYFRQAIKPTAVTCKGITLVAGGDHRQASVYNGLQAVGAKEGIVLIHDGVRPLISRELVAACIEGARRWDGCIPALAVMDTLKRINEHSDIIATVSREGLRQAQTPQAFKVALIHSAHCQAKQNGWRATDDAALVERIGGRVKVIPGSYANIKITTPEDLKLAEAICRYRMENGISY